MTMTTKIFKTCKTTEQYNIYRKMKTSQEYISCIENDQKRLIRRRGDPHRSGVPSVRRLMILVVVKGGWGVEVANALVESLVPWHLATLVGYLATLVGYLGPRCRVVGTRRRYLWVEGCLRDCKRGSHPWDVMWTPLLGIWCHLAPLARVHLGGT